MFDLYRKVVLSLAACTRLAALTQTAGSLPRCFPGGARTSSLWLLAISPFHYLAEYRVWQTLVTAPRNLPAGSVLNLDSLFHTRRIPPRRRFRWLLLPPYIMRRMGAFPPPRALRHCLLPPRAPRIYIRPGTRSGNRPEHGLSRPVPGCPRHRGLGGPC
jgi:hypothetical protein